MRESDALYFKDWSAKNPGYWQKYRAEHSAYVERNRRQQHARNQARIAKDAPCASPDTLLSGRYWLMQATPDMIAKDAAWFVEITVLESPPGQPLRNCK